MSTHHCPEQLIVRLQAGDAQAFATIFNRYRNWLHMVAVDQIGNKLEAQDLVQEYFIEFWEKQLFNKLKVKEGELEDTILKNFMFRSIRYRCLNHVTRQKLNFKSLDGLEHCLIEQIQASPSYQAGYLLEHKDLSDIWKNAIEKAIDKIPKQSAKVFALSTLKNQSRHEIAHDLGLSPNTVKNQLQRANRILREHLKQLGFFNHAAVNENPL